MAKTLWAGCPTSFNQVSKALKISQNTDPSPPPKKNTKTSTGVILPTADFLCQFSVASMVACHH